MIVSPTALRAGQPQTRYWDIDDDLNPSVVWGIFDEKFELKPGGAKMTFVLFSNRSPGPAVLTLRDEAGHEAEVSVEGPNGD